MQQQACRNMLLALELCQARTRASPSARARTHTGAPRRGTERVLAHTCGAERARVRAGTLPKVPPKPTPAAGAAGPSPPPAKARPT
eukprot:10999924-Alexandrium_andersonii.AAC.1